MSKLLWVIEPGFSLLKKGVANKGRRGGWNELRGIGLELKASICAVVFNIHTDG